MPHHCHWIAPVPDAPGLLGEKSLLWRDAARVVVGHSGFLTEHKRSAQPLHIHVSTGKQIKNAKCSKYWLHSL